MTAEKIRRATVGDAEAIARVLVEAWRESYASLMPRDALDRMSVAEHTSRLRETLDDCKRGVEDAAFLVVGADEAPLGFSACGRQRSPRLEEAGFAVEFSSLYLLRRAQGRGIGRELTRLMATHLLGFGYSRASVWVFRDNVDARRFYKKLGAKRTGIDGTWTVLGLTLADISYGWSDLAILTKSTLPHQ